MCKESQSRGRESSKILIGQRGQGLDGLRDRKATLETKAAIIDTRINTFMYKNYAIFAMDYDNNLQKINKLKDSHELKTK